MKKSPLIPLLTFAFPALGWAQQEAAEEEGAAQPEIEEVVVLGRFLSAAESLVAERITVPFSADFLGAHVIGRAGDPDIASAPAQGAGPDGGGRQVRLRTGTGRTVLQRHRE